VNCGIEGSGFGRAANVERGGGPGHGSTLCSLSEENVERAACSCRISTFAGARRHSELPLIAAVDVSPRVQATPPKVNCGIEGSGFGRAANVERGGGPGHGSTLCSLSGENVERAAGLCRISTFPGARRQSALPLIAAVDGRHAVR
jgi:hypothetical protein